MSRLISCKGLYFTIILSGMLVVACGGNGQQSTESNNQAKSFVMPSIPDMITNPAERADYLAKHFWDHFDFSDTLLINMPKVSEQGLVEFLNIFPHVSAQALKSSISKTLEQALVEPKMYAYITGLFEKYLNDPNSQMRNEEFYCLVLECIIGSNKIDDLNKIRPQYQLDQANKNRLGTIAHDFMYTLFNGKQGSMNKIMSEYLLLFFYNPGCSACADYQQGLEYSPVVAQMVERGALKILAMYVGEDIKAWAEYRSSIPASWINGYDALGTIGGKQVYDLRAIPSLYLLDKEKRVILKDALPHQVEELLLYYLQNAN